MGLDSTSCGKELNSIIHETISATPSSCHETTFFRRHTEITTSNFSPANAAQPNDNPENDQNIVVDGGGMRRKKKRGKKPGPCRNKEDEEAQRMTHIAVERNRRRQMNNCLAILRSLLPESYIQRGDQASIVGGAIEFVKELQHLLQSLEAQKLLSTPQNQNATIHDQNNKIATTPTKEYDIPKVPLCFHELFSNPQYTWSKVPNKNTSNGKPTLADIEVNLVQTHANLRILLRKRPIHLSRIIVFLQSRYLSILHLNIITLDPLVLYSISLKVEEECWLNSADEIADAVHQMLELVEEEAAMCIGSRK